MKCMKGTDGRLQCKVIFSSEDMRIRLLAGRNGTAQL